MRHLAILVGILLIPTVNAAWEPWIEDPEGDATLGEGGPKSVDPRHDILGVDVYLDDSFLHIKFRTAAGSDASELPTHYSSRVWFTAGSQNIGTQSISFDADADGLVVSGPDIPSTAWGWETGSTAWDYSAWINLEAAFGEIDGETILLSDPDVHTWNAIGQGDTATAAPLAINQTGSQILTGIWRELEGPDLAGGASVAVDSNGKPWVAYYVYDDRRATPKGIYLASTGPWTAELVSDYSQSEGRDDRMRTQLTFSDTTPHIVFTANPDGGNNQLRYASKDAAWLVEDPTGDHTAINGGETIPDVAVKAGRVLVAFDTSDGVAITEKQGDNWATVTTIDGATYPRLAIGADGKAHLAYALMDSAGREGNLMYAAEPSWTPTVIGGGLNSGWETPETDGSFDFALAPDGTPAFAWDGDRDQNDDRFAFLTDGVVVSEQAPMTPNHGNPQYTIRLAFDAAGQAHLGSGYGGTDIYAVRGTDGTWFSRSTDRHDVWDLAVSEGGTPYFAYTQPHGGTTVALSWLEGGLSYADKAAAEQKPVSTQQDLQQADAAENIPAAPVAVLALAAIILANRRRT